MDDLLRNERDADSIAIVPIEAHRLEDWRANAAPEASAWVASTGFTATPDSTCLVPGRRGRLACVLVGVAAGDDPWALAGVPDAVPAGAYHLDPQMGFAGARAGRARLGARCIPLRAVQEVDAADRRALPGVRRRGGRRTRTGPCRGPRPRPHQHPGERT